jgi:hypothetical protein
MSSRRLFATLEAAAERGPVDFPELDASQRLRCLSKYVL